jgi:hypothetical protein
MRNDVTLRTEAVRGGSGNLNRALCGATLTKIAMRPTRPVQNWTTEEEQRAADRQTQSLAGLALALAIVVIALFLIRELQAKSVLEDCLLAGHHDCGRGAFAQTLPQQTM